MSPIIASIAAFFSLAAFAFYIAAVSGYSKDFRVLKGCQWIYFEQSMDATYYFGLRGYLLTLPGYEEFYFYDGSSSDDYYDDDGTLDKCNSSGKSAMAVSTIACIFSFVTIVTNGAGFKSEETVVKAVSAVLSIIACLFGMIAVGVFMTTCYNKISDNFDDSNDLRYGNGSILTITALICNFFAFILAIMNIVAGGSTAPANQT